MLQFTLIQQGLRTLGRNRMRSSLTILGVAVGIAAVVCVVAIGNAGTQQIQANLENLGENFVWLEAGNRNVGGVRTGARGTKTLVVADMEAILQQVPLMKRCSPQVDSRTQVIAGNQNWNTTYRGVSPEYFQIKRWTIAQGAPFDQYMVEQGAKVVVIGQTVRNYLFPNNEDPIGRTIRVRDVPFTVIGVLGLKGSTGFGDDQDDTILLPYTTAQRRLAGITWLNDILCSAISADAVRPAGVMAAAVLRERHRIRPGEDDDFSIRNPEERIQVQLQASRTMSLLLMAVGSVSLVVGGIGIMNVMLVSVTERTREIGVRMAVGATEQEVQAQFLGEAVMLCVAGGVAGVLLGVAGTFTLGRTLGWPMALSLDALAIAGLFSLVLGVTFGFYPAKKAAGLDPIDALRYE